MSHLLDLNDHDRPWIEAVFDRTDAVKRDPVAFEDVLHRRTLLMLFTKPSTRTRLSFETAMTQLGGHAIDLALERSQVGRGESLSDVARVASRYEDAIMARLFAHADLVELAGAATVPVINGLTDRLHPCQALADLYTLRERDALGRLAYVGDGTNVANSLMQACALLGVECVVATPPGHAPDDDVRRWTQDEGVSVTHDPREAVTGADAVYTDTWVSMGESVDRAETVADFEGYQVDEALVDAAGPDAVFMHCLPAHRGEEVTAAVIDGPRSIVFDQVENRLHVQKALLIELLRVTD